MQLLRAELAVVIEDPVFVRSPSLKTLLTYLVEQSASGRSAALKSYTVAVEGLGRSPDFDPQVDTYARVLVARLRRALDAYYFRAGAVREWRLHIPQGSYAVSLIPNTPYEDLPAGRPLAERAVAPGRMAGLIAGLSRRTWLVLAGVLVLMAGAGLAAALLTRADDADAAVWQRPNFPSVLVRMAAATDSAADPSLTDTEALFEEALGGYEPVRLASRYDPDVAYLVELAPRGTRDAGYRVELIDQRGNRRLYVGAIAASPAGVPDKAAVERLVYGWFGYSGLVTAQEMRNSASPDTPYDCWLRFAGSVVADGSSLDPQLQACTKTWYRHAPRHSIVAALHAWVLVSSSVGGVSIEGRDKRLREARTILVEARARDPNSRHVMLALARTEAMLGDTAALRHLSAELIERHGGNPDFRSMVGTLMILQNDPGGEGHIDAAIAMSAHPPPRYFIGKFIAAMMRDDPSSAGRALERIKVEGHSDLWTEVMDAAYQARIGHKAQARAAWNRAVEMRPLLGMFPQILIDLAPAAKPVKQRILEWLAPVLDD